MGNRPSRQIDPGDVRIETTYYYPDPSGSGGRVYVNRTRSQPTRGRNGSGRRGTAHREHIPWSREGEILERVLDGDGPSPALRRFLAYEPQDPRRVRSDGSVVYMENFDPFSRNGHRPRRRITYTDDEGWTYYLHDNDIGKNAMRMRSTSPTRGLRPGDTCYDRPDSRGYRPMRVYDPTRDLDPSGPGRGI
ncbi:hypothetical protein HRR83_006549 [Exophiala dermatitidis]|uniref:Uncharacterized protein n=1 Tax=Exophiala dermatitidis TaxID=5970 RepID=A0AAN6ITR6_EXODE|nr:hypothetical protein HRR74_005709 [Exophiala dermatitidis]KAJ4515466.1 hypothetical protein HRR73_005298 [Exophiala dermatitidis]KAJ4536476.1 hypothetical protein HRR77_007393 [Exophiala dermatitidis]KAJ4540995.1 hypothetical protein HRR76_004377 [Exophiala dermatitidis]KAJ4554783.1 hypothetical protein HRR79_009358 [Exophiala dermatitidis]